MWRIVLSDPLRVIALVSRYLTNKLIRRDPLIGREHASRGPLWSLSQEKKRHYAVLARVSQVVPHPRQVGHVLLTRSPLGYREQAL